MPAALAAAIAARARLPAVTCHLQAHQPLAGKPDPPLTVTLSAQLNPRMLGGPRLASLGVWSTHRPPAATPRPASGPAFRTAAGSQAHGAHPAARLVGIQTSRQEGFERVEFTFDRAPPGWRAGYTSAIRDAAGRQVALRGKALLSVAFQPAVAHRVGGASSFGARSRTPAYAALQEVRLASDLEGRVQFGLGLATRAGFRVLEATAPSRIIVDVKAP
jgi:hypothetical protein